MRASLIRLLLSAKAIRNTGIFRVMRNGGNGSNRQKHETRDCLFESRLPT